MSDGKKRTLKEWLDEKKMTPEQLMRAGAGVGSDVLTRWAKTGQDPLEVTGPARCLSVADALDVPPEHLDCGPERRGMSEAGYRIVLYTHQTANHDWETYLESWGPPKNWPAHTVSPHPVREGLNDRRRVKGPTAEASLDVLENQLRELIRANPGHRSAVHEA
jgi:hypothetical protein